MYRTPDTNERILWGWTLFRWSTWTAQGLGLLCCALIVFFLGAGILTLSYFWIDGQLRFAQPRDALRGGHAPSYSQVHSDVERHCMDCTTEQLDVFIEARDEALVEDWPDLLAVMTTPWRWKQYSTRQQEWGYTFRDDFLRVIDRVGGISAAEQCRPIVRWTVRSTYVQESFEGLLCNGEPTLLEY